MMGSCYFSLCGPAFLQEPLWGLAQNKCCMRAAAWEPLWPDATVSSPAFTSPRWGLVLTPVLDFSKKMGCFMVASQNPEVTCSKVAYGHVRKPRCWTSTTKSRVSWWVNTLTLTPNPAKEGTQALTSKLSCHLPGTLHVEVAVFSFLRWVILSPCQMLSVTRLTELLGPRALLSVSHGELHKQPTAILAYGYHHSAPQTS